MKLIRMLGLGAVAAIAATAFVGVSSASATYDTTLCTEASPTLACPAEKQASHVHFTANLAKLLNAFQTVECDVLFLGSTTAGTLGKPLVFNGSLTYTCHDGCEAEETELPGEDPHALIFVLKTGANLAEITFSGEVLFRCPAIIHCKFIGTGLVGHGASANPNNNGEIAYNDTAVARLPDSGQPWEGLLCPPSATLDALFISLNPLWIRS